MNEFNLRWPRARDKDAPAECAEWTIVRTAVRKAIRTLIHQIASNLLHVMDEATPHPTVSTRIRVQR